MQTNRNRKGLGRAGPALGVLAVGALCLVGVIQPWANAAGRAASAGSESAAERVAAFQPGPDVRRDATVWAVERVLPSVVNIATETIIRVRDPFEEFFREFWDPYHRRQPPNTQYSLGSGVIIDEAGYVLTNDHVVRRADKIWIKLSTATNIYEATVVATDPKTDLALLKLKSRPGERFTAIQFARDDDLLLGETVLALGNPFGLGGSVSRGILSSKSRVAPKEGEALDVPNWLQTDASINLGNSGGPLVNLRGELIGLNVAILREAQGIGFAIPVKRVSEALSEMVPPEAGARWFGVRVKAGASPLEVVAVEAESPAAKAGLAVGDIVLEVNGQVPRGFIHFNELVRSKPDAVVTVQRGAERRTVTVRSVPDHIFFNAELIQRRLGISLQQLTPQLADALGLSAAEGFVVAGVDQDSPAAAHLQPGYLVLSIDGRRPANLTEAAKLIHAKKKGDPVRLGVAVVQRRGNFIAYQQAAVDVPVR